MKTADSRVASELFALVQSHAELVAQKDALLRSQDALIKELAGALEVAHNHLDMSRLAISHCKDHAQISAALAKVKQ